MRRPAYDRGARGGRPGPRRRHRDCLPEQVGEVGGKAVGLGSLLRAGQRVPASFVVTAGAYREYLRTQPRGLPAPLRASIAGAYAALCEQHGTDVAVAVRSSATVEDSAEASWAGQFQTYLGVSGAGEVLARSSSAGPPPSTRTSARTGPASSSGPMAASRSSSRSSWTPGPQA